LFSGARSSCFTGSAGVPAFERLEFAVAGLARAQTHRLDQVVRPRKLATETLARLFVELARATVCMSFPPTITLMRSQSANASS
jgi:hypothetical protein